MNVMFLLVGIFLGVLVGWLGFWFYYQKKRTGDSGIFNDLQEKRVLLKVEVEKRLNLEYQLGELKDELNSQRERVVKLSSDLSAKNIAFDNLQEKLNDQLKDVEALKSGFKQEFNNLANQIFEEKSKKFTEQNKTNISAVLGPLNEKLKDFEKKIEDTYEKGLKDRTDLRVEVKKLYELNAKISEDANNLTKALKGDVKKQGNWGEVILERILESSGLEKGREYKVQQSFEREGGGRYMPDVVIYLPENKHIIVDAKVSLVAYDSFIAAETEEDQKKYMKEHLSSIRSHIKELSDKRYYKLEGLNAPEYVLMFVPIEASFGVAVKEDSDIFNLAWESKIVIVSPSTLIATLMTVSSVWNQENQTKNAIEIARQSGNLYDKFEGLMGDLLQIGKKLEDAQGFYQSSMKKLAEGKGNLINRVENLKKLGAKASKSLPDKFIEGSELNK